MKFPAWGKECPWGGIFEPKYDFRADEDPLMHYQEQKDGVSNLGEYTDIISVIVSPGINNYAEALKDCLSCPFRPSSKDDFTEGIGCSGLPSIDLDTVFLDSIGDELPIVTVATLFWVNYSGVEGDYDVQVSAARKYARHRANCLQRLSKSSPATNGPMQLKGDPSQN